MTSNATLKVDAGKYVVIAKSWLVNSNPQFDNGIDCRLFVDSLAGNDWCSLYLPKNTGMTAPPDGNNGVLLTQMMAGTIDQTGYVHVVCRAGREQ
jgi:hypothetical protein